MSQPTMKVLVIPAQAGIQKWTGPAERGTSHRKDWTPAYAGVTWIVQILDCPDNGTGA